MAEECISVKFEDGTEWSYCWEDVTPYPTWKSSDVTTGLRKSPDLAPATEETETEEPTTTPRAWKTCQYYMNGMPSICVWWKEGALGDEEGTVTSGSYYCSYVKANTSDNPQDELPDTPTGYNFGQCDFLGRRHWCDKYTASAEENLDEWICVAPNPYLTGLGEKSQDFESAIFRPLSRDKIWGYNDTNDGTGTGLCDCYGMGRGAPGCGVDFGSDEAREARLAKMPIVCNYYRPWQMGFGIIDPAEMRRSTDLEVDGITITEEGLERAREWENRFDKFRLPLNYEIYNLRAKFQKCQWWDEDRGREYLQNDGMIYLDGDPDIFDDSGRVEFCTNPDSAAIDYNTRVYEEATASGGMWEETGAQLALDGVWAKAGGPVCNGCRPDCPGYSGKWTYLTTDKMLPGMPVTANQILELRFYSRDWDTKSDYDDFFNQKPNFDDPRTSAIYTFTKWKKLDQEDPSKSIMLGKKLDLCLPAPQDKRYFTRDYVQVEDITYANVETIGSIGTSTEGTQRHFPSLIRLPEFEEISPLFVAYPYYNDDGFGREICEPFGPVGHIKKHNVVDGDSIRCIGQTIRSKKVYAINTNVIDVAGVVREFRGIYNVKSEEIPKEELKSRIYDALRSAVEDGIRNHPEYISFTQSDPIYGYFSIDPIKLMYYKDINNPKRFNFILICVDYGDGTWEYRWRTVLSKWIGGVILQSGYTHIYPESDEGYSNGQPEQITPSATAILQIMPLGSAPDSGHEAFATYSFEHALTGARRFSYSIQEITIEDTLQSQWMAIGDSNKIWLEIDDINLNYIYDWDLISAELILKEEEEEDEDGTITTTPARKNVPDKVTLRKILVDDDNIPPNACILEPQDGDDTIRIKFLSEEWELKIKYKYQKITNEDVTENVIYGAHNSSFDFYAMPFDFNQLENVIGVSNISEGSVNVLAHINDEYGRVYSTFATKAVMNIVKEACRNVDIFYRYSAMGRKYALMPWKGFCIDIKNDLPFPSSWNEKHVETPDCGDHEGSLWAVQQGPMWFPFDACRGYDMYDEFTVCNNCQAGYVGPYNDGMEKDEEGEPILVEGQVIKRKDYRYCGPYKYDAYGETRGNWAASCDCGCSFSYTDASAATVIFEGYGRIRTSVDLAIYASRDWVPPPFGNDGREYIEKFLSDEFKSHLSLVLYPGRDSLYRSEWMPMAMDHSMFFMSFNAYDTSSEDDYYYISEYYSLDPFRYCNQLNFLMLDNINEGLEIEEDGEGNPTGNIARYRWDEIFEVHHEGNCTYPYPEYPLGTRTKALFYYMKKPWSSWAWQEQWRDIERNLSDFERPALEQEEGEEEEIAAGGGDVTVEKTIDVGKLDFLDIIKPKYVFDAYKEEHRRICDEGAHYIYYTGPKLDDDGNMEKYPTLSLDGAHPRPFEILYDENSYTSSNSVVWKNEGGNADVGGSSDEDNIYEDASGSDWIHDENTIFDSEATSSGSGAEEAGREAITNISAFTGETTTKYYNRGVIIEMTRDRLDYLPKEYTEVPFEITSENEGLFSFEDASVIATFPNMVEDFETTSLRFLGRQIWDIPSVNIETLELEEDAPSFTIATLKVSGRWGSVTDLDPDKTYNLVKPGLGFSANFSDGSSGAPRGIATNVSSSPIIPDIDQGLDSYEINLSFSLGPIEMLQKKITGFTITLNGRSDYYIAVDSIILETAKYIDGRFEGIKVWERKYVVSKYTDVGGSGIDLSGTDDYLRYDEDLNNSGQYFRMRTDRYGEVVTQNKLRTVACGQWYREDINILDLTYDTLHEIEAEEQRKLYEYAISIDPTGDELTWQVIVPYKFIYFFGQLNMNNIWSGEAIFLSETLRWENHERFKRFKQYDYWRPGGHYYTWDPNFRREKCMLFGTPENVFSGYYVHVDHFGVGTPLEVDPSKPIDPGNSYYSLRFYTQVAKYNRAMVLAGNESPPEIQNDLITAANIFNPDIF